MPIFILNLWQFQSHFFYSVELWGKRDYPYYSEKVEIFQKLLAVGIISYKIVLQMPIFEMPTLRLSSGTGPCSSGPT